MDSWLKIFKITITSVRKVNDVKRSRFSAIVQSRMECLQICAKVREGILVKRIYPFLHALGYPNTVFTNEFIDSSKDVWISSFYTNKCVRTNDLVFDLDFIFKVCSIMNIFDILPWIVIEFLTLCVYLRHETRYSRSYIELITNCNYIPLFLFWIHLVTTNGYRMSLFNVGW